MTPEEFRAWMSISPDVGMMYRSKVRNRAEIDALRHLTRRGKVSFVPLVSDLAVRSHEEEVIAKIDVERLLTRCTPNQAKALKIELMDMRDSAIGWNRRTLSSTICQAIRRLRKIVK